MLLQRSGQAEAGTTHTGQAQILYRDDVDAAHGQSRSTSCLQTWSARTDSSARARGRSIILPGSLGSHLNTLTPGPTLPKSTLAFRFGGGELGEQPREIGAGYARRRSLRSCHSTVVHSRAPPSRLALHAACPQGQMAPLVVSVILLHASLQYPPRSSTMQLQMSCVHSTNSSPRAMGSSPRELRLDPIGGCSDPMSGCECLSRNGVWRNLRCWLLPVRCLVVIVIH